MLKPNFIEFTVLFPHSQGFTELILIDLIKIFDENELEVWFFSFDCYSSFGFTSQFAHKWSFFTIS